MRRPTVVMSRVVTSAVLALSMLLGGASAEAGSDPITTWVDDDGAVGADDCSGGQETFTSIQLAIELAGPGDTINVCPGRYPEELNIDGRSKRRLTLRSVTRHEAVLTSPPVSYLHALIAVFSNRVTIDGFRLDLAPVGDKCGVGTGVRARVRNRLTIRNLLVEGGYGAAAASGTPCLYTGIEGGATTMLTIESSVLTGYLVPMHLDGTLRITDNRLEPKAWRLPDDTHTPCARPAITAISLNRAVPAVIRNNQITQRLPGGDQTPRMSCAGIRAYGVTVISENVIDGFEIGIETYNRPLAERNTVTNAADTGIKVEGRGEIRFNTITGGARGLAASGQRAYLHDNTIAGNTDTACIDRTTPAGKGWPYTFGTGNRWVNNDGGPSQPTGLCTKAAS